MKKIVLLNAHPRKGSLSDALCEAYAKGALAAGAELRQVAIRDLKFDALRIPVKDAPLEADLKSVQNDISWCDHLVVVFPTWWTALPALAKGFFDLTFSSGWAFEYVKGFPKGLLAGRSGRVIHTSGAPSWVSRWIYGQPEVRMLKTGVLQFCGIKPVSVTKFGGVMGQVPSPETIKYVAECERIGASDARA